MWSAFPPQAVCLAGLCRSIMRCVKPDCTSSSSCPRALCLCKLSSLKLHARLFFRFYEAFHASPFILSGIPSSTSLTPHIHAHVYVRTCTHRAFLLINSYSSSGLSAPSLCGVEVMILPFWLYQILPSWAHTVRAWQLFPFLHRTCYCCSLHCVIIWFCLVVAISVHIYSGFLSFQASSSSTLPYPLEIRWVLECGRDCNEQKPLPILKEHTAWANNKRSLC